MADSALTQRAELSARSPPEVIPWWVRRVLALGKKFSCKAWDRQFLHSDVYALTVVL